MYNPHSWYWIVGPGNKVFSSALGEYVVGNDPTYLAWLSRNNPTKISSELELLEVLDQQAPEVVANFPLGLLSFARKKQNLCILGGITVNVGSAKSPIKIFCETDNSSRANLHGLHLLAQADPNFTTTWVGEKDFTTLTSVQILSMVQDVHKFIQKSYKVLAQVLTDIQSGKITTKQEIEQAAWPKS